MEFDQLMARHKDAVYRQMVRMCGNPDDAEDVLSESLLSAYRAMQHGLLGTQRVHDVPGEARMRRRK